MTASQQTPPTPQTARLIHAAMGAGVVLFAIVVHFVLRPTAPAAGGLSSMMPMLLSVSLAGCALSLLLSRRVPRASNEESADSFWKRAGQPALISWALVEGAGLLAVVLYSQTGSTAAITVAAVAVFILVLLNPAYFERR